MKKSLSTRHVGIECTEANLIKYANQVFAVTWICTDEETHIVYCNKVVVHQPFHNWFSARRLDDIETRSFLVNDRDVRILIR
jgi:hypothetical protein